MNRKYDDIMNREDSTRRRSSRLYYEMSLNKKPYIWIKSKKMGLVVSWGDLKHLDENLYLNIPFPWKQK